MTGGGDDRVRPPTTLNDIYLNKAHVHMEVYNEY